MARIRSTIEPDAPVDGSTRVFYPDGPTLDELQDEDSTWYYRPAVREKYLSLAGDPEKVWKPRQDYRSDNGMLRLNVQARNQARRCRGLSLTHDEYGDLVDYREQDQKLPPPPDVVGRLEAFFIHWQLGVQAERLVDQAESAAKSQADYVRSHTSLGSGRVHPRTVPAKVLGYSDEPTRLLSPGVRAGAEFIFGLQALLGTHVDGRPVYQHLLEDLADELEKTESGVPADRLAAVLAELVGRRR